MRELIGAADPKEAAEGTLRNLFGLKEGVIRDKKRRYQRNAVHGSDSPESAIREIGIFFPQLKTNYHSEKCLNEVVKKIFVCDHCANQETRDVLVGCKYIDCTNCGNTMEGSEYNSFMEEYHGVVDDPNRYCISR